MIQFLLIAKLALAVIAAVAIIVARSQSKKVAQMRSEMLVARDELRLLNERAAKLKKASDKKTKVKEEADAQRKELKQTADGDLVDRANALFK